MSESLFAYALPQHFTWGSFALWVVFMALCAVPFALLAIVYMGANGARDE